MNRQTIIILIFVVVLGSLGYAWYNYQGALPGVVQGGSERSFGSRLSDLRRLKDLELDVSIFQNQFFKTLQAPEEMGGQTPIPSKSGRANPFLPF